MHLQSAWLPSGPRNRRRVPYRDRGRVGVVAWAAPARSGHRAVSRTLFMVRYRVRRQACPGPTGRCDCATNNGRSCRKPTRVSTSHWRERLVVGSSPTAGANTLDTDASALEHRSRRPVRPPASPVGPDHVTVASTRCISPSGLTARQSRIRRARVTSQVLGLAPLLRQSPALLRGVGRQRESVAGGRRRRLPRLAHVDLTARPRRNRVDPLGSST